MLFKNFCQVFLKLWIRNTFETGHTKSDDFIEISRQCKSVSTNIVEKHLLVLLQSCFMPSRGSDTTWWGGGDAFCFYSALESSQQNITRSALACHGRALEFDLKYLNLTSFLATAMQSGRRCPGVVFLLPSFVIFLPSSRLNGRSTKKWRILCHQEWHMQT